MQETGEVRHIILKADKYWPCVLFLIDHQERGEEYCTEKRDLENCWKIRADH